MIVRIEQPAGDETPEWCCLEFQGEIVLGEGEDMLGNLSLNGNDVTLLLDHQILTGRVHKLEKPLVITNDLDTNHLEIVAVIKKKIIFNTRPQPRIMS